MTFYAWELDICPSFGWQGGPSANTRVDTLRNRHERRLARAELMQHLFSLPFDAIDDEDYYGYVKEAHAVMYGMAHSFLVKDHLDYTSGRRNDPTDRESIGVAPSGTTAVQLYKTYAIRLPDEVTVVGSRTRPITKPLSTVIVYQADGGGNPIAKAGTLDTLTGLFTPATSWTAGRAISWAGEYRVPVRFNNDYMPASIEAKSESRRFIRGSIELIEVFGE